MRNFFVLVDTSDLVKTLLPGPASKELDSIAGSKQHSKPHYLEAHLVVSPLYPLVVSSWLHQTILVIHLREGQLSSRLPAHGYHSKASTTCPPCRYAVYAVFAVFALRGPNN